MKDFIKPNSDNLGGVITFNFIPSEDIESIATAIDGIVTEEVVLKANKQWYSGYGTLGTISYNEPSALSSAGTAFQRMFSAFYPKDCEEMNFLFNEMRNRRFVIDYTDSNGLRKLVGSIEEPVSFTSALNTQSDIPQRAGHTLSFFGDGTHKSYIYDL